MLLAELFDDCMLISLLTARPNPNLRKLPISISEFLRNVVAHNSLSTDLRL